MTADDLRAVPAYVNNAMGHTVVALLVTEAERDALAALIDAAASVLEFAYGTDDDPACIVDGQLLGRLRDAVREVHK